MTNKIHQKTETVAVISAANSATQEEFFRFAKVGDQYVRSSGPSEIIWKKWTENADGGLDIQFGLKGT